MTIEAPIAIHGGNPAVPDGPPTWPLADRAVESALQAVFQSGDWGRYHGTTVDLLEQLLAEAHGVPHAMTCSSGTIAVEIALRGLNVSSGDEVILAGYDFSGNFRAIEAVGARPVLADIDPNSWTMTAKSIEAAIGPDVRAVIVSHLHGGTANMPAICRVANEYNIAVVEDACQADGATVSGRMAGSWGDVGVLSFGGSKLVTAGRGGAVLTSRADAMQRMRVFCERGNHAFALSELQAAVLIPQWHLLPERNKQRYDNVLKLLGEIGVHQGFAPIHIGSELEPPSFYKLAWLYDPTRYGGTTRERLTAAIRAEGIAMDVGFAGFTKRSSRRCRKTSELKHCKTAAKCTVLLHHPILLGTSTQIEQTALGIDKVLSYYEA